MDFEPKYFKTIDWFIVFILIGFAIFSYLGIAGATPDTSSEMKQLISGVNKTAISIKMPIP